MKEINIKDKKSSILKPTMKLRWINTEYTSKVFWQTYIDKYTTLQQMFIDEDGNEIWKNIDVVNST